MTDCSHEHEIIRRLIEAQKRTIERLNGHVNALAPLVSDLRENALLIKEIRADLVSIDARQAALNTRLDNISNTAITAVRPGATIQIGGFVLAITLVLLNLLGMRISYDKQRGFVIESDRRERSTFEDADRRGGLEVEALPMPSRETDDRGRSQP